MTTPVSNLTLVPNQDDENLEISEAGLREFITEFLRESPDLAAGTTPAMVLEDPVYIDFLADCQKAYEMKVQSTNEERAKQRRALENERHRVKTDVANALRNKLREQAGLPRILTQEEIRAKARAIHEQVTAKPTPAAVKPPSQQPTVQDNLDKLWQQFNMELPDLVFNSQDQAVMFRQILKECIKPFQYKLKQDGLDPEYRVAIKQRRDRVQKIFPMAGEVITEGWGLELQSAFWDDDLCDEILDTLSQDDRFAGMVKWMGKCPTMDEIKAEAVAQAETQAKLELERKAFNDLRDQLKARLKETSPHLSDDNIEQMAKGLAKKFGHLLGIDKIFAAAAVYKMARANGKDFEEKTAKVYAKAAGMTDEQLAAAVAANAPQEQKPISDNSAPKPSANNPKTDKKARRARQLARNKADNAARPKPNEGSGDIAKQSLNGAGKKK